MALDGRGAPPNAQHAVSTEGGVTAMSFDTFVQNAVAVPGATVAPGAGAGAAPTPVVLGPARGPGPAAPAGGAVAGREAKDESDDDFDLS